jgi:hypothetical protein
MNFYTVDLRRKQQSLCLDILCEDCRAKAPELQTPLTDREKAHGYEYVIRPYTGDHECYDCGAVPAKAERDQKGAA